MKRVTSPDDENQSCLDEFLISGASPRSGDKSSQHRPTQTRTQDREPSVAKDPPATQPPATSTIAVADDEEELIEEEIVGETEEEVVTEYRVSPNEVPRDAPPSFLLSVDYSGEVNKAVARLYDPESKATLFWFDNTGHQPYCYTDLPPQTVERLVGHNRGLVRTERVELKDLLHDKTVVMTKVVGNNPLAIGGKTGSIRDLLIDSRYGKVPRAWEANIRYRNCFVYDREIVAGMFYRIEQGSLIPVPPVIDENVIDELRTVLGASEHTEAFIKTYAPLFFTEVPHIRRIAIDIEVYTPVLNKVPSAEDAEYPVIAIGLSDNEGLQKCLILRRNDVPMGERPADMSSEVVITPFDNERDMLLEAFKIIDQYPVVLTFVGDSFDMKYLYHRASKVGVDLKRQCPIHLGKDVALLHKGIHIDLYKFLKNPSIRTYALYGAYEMTNLDSIAKGLLGVGKLPIRDEISRLSVYELAHYCWHDANITLQITTYKNELLFRLIVLFMRISRLSMEDVTRQGISAWIQSLFRQEHRSRKALIPRQVDIETAKSAEAHTEAINREKRFKGAIVIDPIAGVHFDTTVLDFASLYPTIMKRHNISYETVDCPHEECRHAKDNRVPETGHWICKKNRGMISQTIGLFRDIRVAWFKAKSKDKSLDSRTREWYSVVERALKVFVNASYGVTGAAHFELFCMPAAESVTAFGRDAIMRTKRKAESLGVRVLYGDTDSVFLDSPTPQQEEAIIRWSQEELGIELEVDKRYKYVALSDRKKNYIGVYPAGQVEVKGLSGKKRNTPLFAQNAFREMLSVLGRVDSPQGFEAAKDEIRRIINHVIDRLENRAEPYTLEELAFRVQLTKNPDEYGQTVPQHVRAARMLKEKGYDVSAGNLVEFIKTKGDGVLPLQLARGTTYWIDKDKYIETLKSVFEQVLDSVGIDFQELLGFTTLEQFF